MDMAFDVQESDPRTFRLVGELDLATCDRLMERGKLVEYGPGYRPPDHDVRRPVRIAALERLRTEHGIVPAMPAGVEPARR